MTSLPLTPIESYLYHDDVPAHPCWQIGRFRWTGRFRKPELERAWAEATGRHPLWSAAVGRGPLGGLRWELERGTRPPVHWSHRDPGKEWPHWQPLDLGRGPGARLYVVEADTSVDCIVCVHHAVCDGLAILEVMEDVFVLYALALGEPLELRSAATAAALRGRGRFGSTLLQRLGLPLLQMAGMLAEAGLLRRTVAPLLPGAAAESPLPPSEWPALVSRRWTQAETNALKNAARLAKVSLNELCLRDLQAAIGAWRLAQGVDRPDDWIRLGTAVSLRRLAKGPWPAANMFGIALIERQARSLANRERLLRRAHEDLGLVEKWNFGYAFWMLLWLRRWWPGGIRAYARRPVVRMTFVMSYLGKALARNPLRREGQNPAVPGAVLYDMQGLAPTRAGTCCCADVGLFFGHFGADFNYDPRVLTRGQATALMDEFARQLALSAAGN